MDVDEKLEAFFNGRTLGYNRRDGWFWRAEGYDEWDWEGPTAQEFILFKDILSTPTEGTINERRNV